MQFAARHAEGIYTGGIRPEGTVDGSKEIRRQAAANGRDLSMVKAFIGISPILGRTLEEAQEKFRMAEEAADVHAGLAPFCGYSGTDLSEYPFDEPFNTDNFEEGRNQIVCVLLYLKL
jgi:alkanesulfonate monooxygenase SsuD/methylene tetrahydromethanopterin reductase-like flavin-dependent oxidoreductase (luciferase family)